MTSALVAVDDEWYTDFDHRPIHGYAAPYSLTLDLGDLSSWEHPVLVAHGWVDYAHSTSNWAASQRELSLFPPRLEVEDANGTWRLITTDMGTPAGLPKDMVFDLSDALTEDVDRVRLRITTSMSIYWDQFQVGRSVGQYSVQRARFDEADLHWRGYPVHESIHGTFAFRYDHSQVNTEAPWGTHAGAYTRFGDVSELTDQIDDRFAGPVGKVVAVGQTLELRHGSIDQALFTEAESGAPKPGHTFQVFVAVVVIDIDPFTAVDDHRALFFMGTQIGIWMNVVGDITGGGRVWGECHGGLLFKGWVTQ